MNFSVDGSDTWDSTPTQEVFIQKYFTKNEISIKSTNKTAKKRKKKFNETELYTASSNSLKNVIPAQIPNTKKIKKSKQSLMRDFETFSPQCTEKSQLGDDAFKLVKKNSTKKLKNNSSETESTKQNITNPTLDNKSEVSDHAKSSTTNRTVVEKSSKQDFDGDCKVSKKIKKSKKKKHDVNGISSAHNEVSGKSHKLNLKSTNSTFIPKMDKSEDLDNFQTKSKKQRKKKLKINKGLQIQNESIVSNIKESKIEMQNPGVTKNSLLAVLSNDSEDEHPQKEPKNTRKRKLKSKKVPQNVELSDSEDEVPQTKNTLKKKESQSNIKSQNVDLNDSKDVVSQNKSLKKKELQNNKSNTKSKIVLQKFDLSDSEDEVPQKKNKNLKKKESQSNKSNTKSKEPKIAEFIEDNSEDDEAIRSELQNSRMFLKIQKLMKAAPHLNPNFAKNSEKDGDSSFEEVSTEYSSDDDDEDHFEDSEDDSICKKGDDSMSNDDTSDNDESLEDGSSKNEDSLNDQSSDNDEPLDEEPSKVEEKNIKFPRTKTMASPKQDTEAQRPSNIKKSLSLIDKARAKLASAKFRYLNEKLYTETGSEAFRYFQENQHEFEDYHLGYGQQVSKWPLNPVDEIIVDLQKLKKSAVIADLGCGEAKIARVLVGRRVHSFDLVAMHDCVTPCDFSKVPLPDSSVDVAVFCLSLMGVNLVEYLREAYRILKIGATLKIAEVGSRIEDLDRFINSLKTLGFTLERKNTKHKLFVFLDLKKVKKGKSSKAADITLRPCMYKKR